MNKLATNQIEEFLVAYRKFLKDSIDRRLHEYKLAFYRFRQPYEPLLEEASRREFEYRRKHAPEFNIFKLLDIETLEDFTHTRFLIDLLDPKGSHGQHFLFLGRFLKILRSKKIPVPAGKWDSHEWIIQSEVHTPFGIPDIVISCKDLDYLCVIENKIYHHERPNQLKDYGQWMKSIIEEFPSQALVLLTPEGRKPISGPAYRLSFKTDIYDWLHNILIQESELITPEKLRGTLIQYLEIISDL